MEVMHLVFDRVMLLSQRGKVFSSSPDPTFISKKLLAPSHGTKPSHTSAYHLRIQEELKLGLCFQESRRDKEEKGEENLEFILLCFERREKRKRWTKREGEQEGMGLQPVRPQRPQSKVARRGRNPVHLLASQIG